MMGRLFRDIIISLGFMGIFFGASSLFAGKTKGGNSVKRAKSGENLQKKQSEDDSEDSPEDSLDVFGKAQRKYLGALKLAISDGNAPKVNAMLQSLLSPVNKSPRIQAVLFAPSTRREAINEVGNNDTLRNIPTIKRTLYLLVVNTFPKKDQRAMFEELQIDPDA
jgi:hypothetical protein